jgi:hypothetical protein
MKEWNFQELAEKFNVTKPTITNWCKAGYFPNAYHKNAGGGSARWVIPDDDVKRFVRPKVGKPLKDYRHIDEAKIAEIIAFYENGGSKPEASLKFDLTVSDISNILIISGIKLRRYTASKRSR